MTVTLGLNDPLALGDTQVTIGLSPCSETPLKHHKSGSGMDPSSVRIWGSCNYKQQHLGEQEGFLLLVFQA